MTKRHFLTSAAAMALAPKISEPQGHFVECDMVFVEPIDFLEAWRGNAARILESGMWKDIGSHQEEPFLTLPRHTS